MIKLKTKYKANEGEGDRGAFLSTEPQWDLDGACWSERQFGNLDVCFTWTAIRPVAKLNVADLRISFSRVSPAVRLGKSKIDDE